MLQIFTIIAPLFLIIFMSALVQKVTKVGDRWSDVLNEFAFKVGLPSLIFSVLVQTPFSFQEQAEILLVNSGFFLIAFPFIALLGRALRLSPKMFRTFFICCVFFNMAYLGIPVITQISGPQALPQISIIIAIHLFWLFTIGIGYLEHLEAKKSTQVLADILRKFLKNPLLIAVLLGITVSALQIPVPEIIQQPLEMIGASVTPLVLIVIGFFIGSSKVGYPSHWVPVLLFSVMTLFILPAGMYFGLQLSGYDPSRFFISILEIAMPIGITPFAFADQYDLDKTFIARAVVLSTILSAFSLPFWISVLS